MNDLNSKAGLEKPLERRVKSVNFTDQVLYDFANQRADNLYGGNFTGYVTALIERDRSMAESRRTLHDFESQILRIVQPHGGRLGKDIDPFDFEVPDLKLVIEARSRFPRERQLEYQLLSSIQKLAITSPQTRIFLTYPTDLTDAEKERFRQFESAGIANLQTGDLHELESYISSIGQTDQFAESEKEDSKSNASSDTCTAIVDDPYMREARKAAENTMQRDEARRARSSTKSSQKTNLTQEEVVARAIKISHELT